LKLIHEFLAPAKLSIGYNLYELKNQITKTTSAYFEPALDYVIVKVPRWNFDKFPGASTTLGLQMKSVGEVMAIGRSFKEAIQKACQSLESNRLGLGADGKMWTRVDDIVDSLENPSWDRLFKIKDALTIGIPIKTIFDKTKIDKWYIQQINDLVELEKQIKKFTIETLPHTLFLEAKQNGYSDAQLAFLLGRIEEDVVRSRRFELGIKRTYKMVDTCAAEFEAHTPYYYSSFEGENESIVSDKKKVIVLGSGPNRIGQGIEFDYCCVHGVLALKEEGYEAIMVNCNPNTLVILLNTNNPKG